MYDTRLIIFLAIFSIFLPTVVFAAPIHQAAKTGNLDAIKIIVAQSADKTKTINEQDEEGYTALHWAVADGKIQIVPWLLQNGADVSLRTKARETPLLLAGKHGRPQTAVYLIQSGGDVQDMDQNMQTAVALAAENGHSEVLKVLLDRGANVNGSAIQCGQEPYCESGPWPINLAVRNGRRDVIKLLLAKGAETNSTIATAKDEVMVGFLFSLGVKPDAGDLLEIARRNDISLLKMVLNKTTPETCLIALQSIGIHRDYNYDIPEIKDQMPYLGAMRLLLERAPNAASKVPTLLHLSVIKNDLDITLFLLSKGFSVNAHDPFGNTPLHWAASAGILTREEDKPSRLNKVRLLLEHGANINAKNNWDNTPLHRAIPENIPEVVEYLLKHGANVSVKNELGVTPLHMAALRGQMEVARLLLARKANPNARMQRGTQPLHAAAAAAHADMARLLIEKGADVNGLANHKMTPLHYALAGGYTFEITRELAPASSNNRTAATRSDIFGRGPR